MKPHPPRAIAAAAAALAALAACGGGPAGEPPEQAAPPHPPVITHWEDVQGVMVPVSADDGPSTGAWEPYRGYSRTPQGAALAAIGQSVQLATATDSRWAAILSGVAAPGEGRDTYAAHRSLLSMTGPVDPQVAPAIAGYVVVSYSADEADIDVVQRYPDNSLGSSRSTVVWLGGDWKLKLPTPDGTHPAQALASLPPEMTLLEEHR